MRLLGSQDKDPNFLVKHQKSWEPDKPLTLSQPPLIIPPPVPRTKIVKVSSYSIRASQFYGTANTKPVNLRSRINIASQ